MSTLFIAFPVYNTGSALGEFLKEADQVSPLLRKLGVDLQFIAVDDASDDADTIDILQSDKKVSVIRHDQNRGCFASLMSAIKYVEKRCEIGDYMAWLDSDNEHRPMHLVSLLAVLQQDMADMAMLQLIFRPQYMQEFDREQQRTLGALEARVLLGNGHIWHQHCPGCWMVKCSYLARLDILLRAYKKFFQEQENVDLRWGEDMIFAAFVNYVGGRVNYDTMALSHKAAPNRTDEKIIAQYDQAIRHLRVFRQYAERDMRPL